MTAPVPGFAPTHVVPQGGMPAWEAPDPDRPTVPLDALLPVQLAERRGDWAHVVCSNGWSAWVDGRLLVAVPQDPPRAGRPAAATADPRPLLAGAEAALARYRGAVEDLSAGALDGETFRRRTHGTRIGVVVDGEDVWLFDAAHERWVYADGTRLSTYAVEDAPRAERPPARAVEDIPRVERPPARAADDAPGDERPPARAADDAPRPDRSADHAPTRVVRADER
ncbi:hypothetical protein AB0E88_34040 [Streptomyces sp. NPDC028635]|uniref:hypothetical protein n=1 Tax=Streptomyces sp. NPDC028635 TaxID=3154800 RepID=UPI0033F066B0